MSNQTQCRRLINDLLTAKNPDGSLVHPKGLFVDEIKAHLDPSWGYGDIGGALNGPPLRVAPGDTPIILMGIYAVQDNGYAAKRWTAVTPDNLYATRSLLENIKTAETMIRKTVNNRLRPAIKALLDAKGDSDDLPTVNLLLDQALTNIALAKKAGDEKAARIKAEKEAKTAKADTKAVKAAMAEKEAELEELKAKLAEAESKITNGS